MNQYQKLTKDNLDKLYADGPADVGRRIGAEKKEEDYVFTAFGQPCRIAPGGVFLGDVPAPDVQGLLISLYALHAVADALEMEPFKAFKDFPDSMPYIGAFTSHTEQVLVPHVEEIMANKEKIMKIFSCKSAPASFSGDISFVVMPLPKIALCYIFYLADDDFPASATCLYSANANSFLPMDALADIGEYTTKSIIQLISTR